MEVRSSTGVRVFCLYVLLAGVSVFSGSAAERELHFHKEANDLFIQVEGDDDDDWFIEASADLTNWVEVAGFGTILSNPTNAPVRSVGLFETPSFYRARRTQGLFDTNLLRTIHLTFTNSNWQELLASGRTNGGNTPALLTLANGAIITNVGARYRGNSSFEAGGEKKSINLEIDFGDPEADLMGYSTINLNNAAEDETMMREVVYFNTMAEYAPCPEAAIVKLMINGTNWGVYSLLSQANNQLIRKYFPSDKGDRWRTPNLPWNSDFRYLGASTNQYTRYYELRSTTSSNAWDRLLNAIIVLNQTPTTPTNIFRDKMEEAFAVDRWLWFLAIENIFVDEDSYWAKGSDFSFYYEVESGRIHPIQHDGNEVLGWDTSVDPLFGSAGIYQRTLLYKFLNVSELRERYLAHMRTIIEEQFHPAKMTPTIISIS